MFTAYGPDWVREVQEQGFPVFLDLKFHDIPNTVAQAVTAAANLGVSIVNVHASGGLNMMNAAKEALSRTENKPWLIGVTVLTSMQDSDLQQIGVPGTVRAQAQRLAELCHLAQLDGVVCSAYEASTIKAEFPDLKCICPGIRLPEQKLDDQNRVASPSEALALGADILVMGRSIWQSKNPIEQLHQVIADIG